MPQSKRSSKDMWGAEDELQEIMRHKKRCEGPSTSMAPSLPLTATALSHKHFPQLTQKEVYDLTGDEQFVFETDDGCPVREHDEDLPPLLSSLGLVQRNALRLGWEPQRSDTLRNSLPPYADPQSSTMSVPWVKGSIPLTVLSASIRDVDPAHIATMISTAAVALQSMPESEYK